MVTNNYCQHKVDHIKLNIVVSIPLQIQCHTLFINKLSRAWLGGSNLDLTSYLQQMIRDCMSIEKRETDRNLYLQAHENRSMFEEKRTGYNQRSMPYKYVQLMQTPRTELSCMSGKTTIRELISNPCAFYKGNDSLYGHI